MDLSTSPPVGDLMIRPMRPEDLPVCAEISDASFYALDRATLRPPWPEPAPRTPAATQDWLTRAGHFLATDPGGCWIAEADGVPIGLAISHVRELTWALATFAVRPGVQGAGVGRQLLEAALQHGRGCLRAILAASVDPRALRRYHAAGFDLHPAMALIGTVDRSRIPAVRHVREATAGDIDLMNSVDRRARGSGRPGDHEVMAQLYRMIVIDRPNGQGYAVLSSEGVPILVSATTRKVAASLTWEGLAGIAEGAPIALKHVTGANQWLIDVGMSARLELHAYGYLGVRGMKPPAPYLHHGTFL